MYNNIYVVVIHVKHKRDSMGIKKKHANFSPVDKYKKGITRKIERHNERTNRHHERTNRQKTETPMTTLSIFIFSLFSLFFIMLILYKTTQYHPH